MQVSNKSNGLGGNHSGTNGDYSGTNGSSATTNGYRDEAKNGREDPTDLSSKHDSKTDSSKTDSGGDKGNSSGDSGKDSKESSSKTDSKESSSKTSKEGQSNGEHLTNGNGVSNGDSTTHANGSNGHTNGTSTSNGTGKSTTSVATSSVDEQKDSPSDPVPARHTGTVKWFNVHMGWGWITRDDPPESAQVDLFVHVDDIDAKCEEFEGAAMNGLRDGERVEFTIAQGRKPGQWKAVNVTGPGGTKIIGQALRGEKRQSPGDGPGPKKDKRS